MAIISCSRQHDSLRVAATLGRFCLGPFTICFYALHQRFSFVPGATDHRPKNSAETRRHAERLEHLRGVFPVRSVVRLRIYAFHHQTASQAADSHSLPAIVCAVSDPLATAFWRR